MDYIEVSISDLSGFDPEIVVAQLAELGFESFTESETVFINSKVLAL